jgi:chromosome segregation ATPase
MFLASFAISARAQSPESRPAGLESEVTEVRAENGVIREQLRKLEEQQQTLLQLVGQLQRRLDGRPSAIVQQSSPAPQTHPVPAA